MSGQAGRRVVHVDLATVAPFAALLQHADRTLLALLWWRGLPLGSLEVTPEQATASSSLAGAAAASVAPAVIDRLELNQRHRWDAVTLAGIAHGPLLRRLDDGSDAPPPDLPPLSVVVCPSGGPEALQQCLAALTAGRVQPREIVVVDDARTGDSTSRVVERFTGVRYVREAQPGSSAARNCGLRATTGSLIAFVDDDVQVHPDWAWRLLLAFTEHDVMAVTGLVLPLESDMPAQIPRPSELQGFQGGFRRRSYDRGFFARHRSRGVPTWRIGVGANMALRRDAVAAVGAFDERLGAGAAGSSEDTEFWYRLLAAGWRCAYEPAAVVFRSPPRDVVTVRRQASAHAQGQVTAMFVQFARHRHWGNVRRAFVSLPASYLRQAPAALMATYRRRGWTPTRLYLAQVSGYMQGLHSVRLALAPPRTKTRLGRYLRANPYPHPLTEGWFYREKMRAIHAIAPDSAPHHALEVGGGQSALTSLLYPAASVTNVDLEPDYAASPQNRRLRLRFVAADATRLPFADSSFDAVTLFDVLEHIPDDGAAVKEVLRVLRPGGSVLVTSPNQRWRFPYYRVLRPLCPSDREVMADWGHVRRGYATSDLARLFNAPPIQTAGFINPVTAFGHDLAFSRLPATVRLPLCAVTAPLIWLVSWRIGTTTPGTETAWRWQKPA
ncbi:MAG: glycosyltransferase [Actinomycetota bacterium]|nr:glycosyltransferase [Actinomycetota bacterium]